MWDVLWWFLLCLYIPACIGLIIIVLLQKGKGAGFAGAFGIGAGSETVFGPQTAQGMPVKITYAMATAFMTIALLMSLISGRVGAGVAPELEDETAMSGSVEEGARTGLEEFGLGSGVTGQVDSSAISVDAPAVESSPIVVETPAEEAPAVPETAAPAETPEAAVDAPAEDVIGEPAPVEDVPDPAANEPSADAPDLSVLEPETTPDAQ